MHVHHTLAALAILTTGAASATTWTNLYTNDFEAETVGSTPTSLTQVMTTDDATITIVSASVDGAGAIPQAPITGNAMRIFDPNTLNGVPDPSQARAVQDLGQNYTVLRTDFDVRRYNTGGAFTPFRVVFNGTGESVGTFRQRAVEVRLKMSGFGIEAVHQTAPGFGATSGRTTNLDFFDGGSSGNTFQDETLSVSIVANSHRTQTLTYDALDGSGSLDLAPKTYHVYTEGSGAPSVGVLTEVLPTAAAIYGDDEGPFYFTTVNTTGGVDYYDEDAELGRLSFFAANDEGPFDFMFDNLSISTTPVPEPASATLLGLTGLALLRRR